MPNMRIVYNNAAKRSTITADQTIGNLAATNMLTDLKGEVWRGSNSNARTITLTWGSVEAVSCVVLPFCSLSATSTIRVRGYSDVALTNLLFNTGYVLAAPSSLIGAAADWGVLPFGVNAYSYGGSSAAAVYFAPANVQGLVIDILDTSNPLGYIEVGCIVVGAYWSPTYNVQYGEVQVEVNDSSKHERSDAGDLFTDRGVITKAMNLTLQHMPAGDRDYIWRILRGNGMGKPVWISISPESSDKMEEQEFSIYGKLSKGSALQYQFMGQFQTSLQVEEL